LNDLELISIEKPAVTLRQLSEGKTENLCQGASKTCKVRVIP